MKIGLYSRLLKDKDLDFVQRLLDVLATENIRLFIFHDYYQQLTASQRLHLPTNIQIFHNHQDIQTIDYLLSVGGDGTLLDTLTLIRDSQIPVLGFNIGRLGFLANADQPDLDLAIEALAKKDFELDTRSLLEVKSNKPIFGADRYGLNEFTIHKQDASAMISIHTYVNDEYLTSYWADGVIVATPTGSTAYSMSCGGPIIAPNACNFVITPVAPHNLTARPIVIPDHYTISFEVEARSPHFLCTLDSRYEIINASYRLSVSKATFGLPFIHLKNKSFFQTIRKKLMWGVDARRE